MLRKYPSKVELEIWKFEARLAGSLGRSNINNPKQVINTLPDNFRWEKDRYAILVQASGLYQVPQFN